MAYMALVFVILWVWLNLARSDKEVIFVFILIAGAIGILLNCN